MSQTDPTPTPTISEAGMRETIDHLLSVMLTCREKNTDEWMEYLVETINEAATKLGYASRAVFIGHRGDGFIEQIDAKTGAGVVQSLALASATPSVTLSRAGGEGEEHAG